VHKESDGAYHPNGEWQLYKYYAQMAGDRLATTASSDSRFDVFATKAGSVVKIIAGTRTILAPYDIKVFGLQSLGLPEKGNVRVNVTRFDWAGDRGRVDAPVELGQSVFAYTGNTVRISCREWWDLKLTRRVAYDKGERAEELDGVCVPDHRLGQSIALRVLLLVIQNAVLLGHGKRCRRAWRLAAQYTRNLRGCR
jgi:hypothetical protein